jgi:hypothetical protein
MFDGHNPAVIVVFLQRCGIGAVSVHRSVRRGKAARRH